MALDISGTSSSSLRRPGHSLQGLRSLSASQLSLLRQESAADAARAVKAASLLRSSPSAGVSILADVAASTALGPTNATFHGSCISDLRLAVSAQQRQLDGLVDKVAALLSAMHSEVLQDVHNLFEKDCSQAATHLQELQQVGADLTERFQATQGAEASLQDLIREEMRQAHENLSGELEQRLTGELESVHARVTGDVSLNVSSQMEAVHEHVSQELRNVHASLAGETHGMQSSLASEVQGLHSRLDSLVDSTLLLRERDDRNNASQQEDLRRELFDSALTPFSQRLLALEEQAAHPQSQEEADARLDRLESGSRRHERELECLVEEVSHFAQVAQSTQQLEESCARVEDRQEAARASAEGRISALEQWRRQMEDRLERHHPQQLRDRLVGTEERLVAVQERVDSLAETLQDVRHGSSKLGGSTFGLSADGRMDEMSENIEAISSSLTTECRKLDQRIREGLDALRNRLENIEGSAEISQRQQVQRRPPVAPRPADAIAITANEEARLSQVQQVLQHIVEGLRHDLQQQIANAREEASRTAEQLRKDWEATAQRGSEEMRKHMDVQLGDTQSSSQRLASELRKEMETRCTQLRGASNRISEENQQLRQDLDAISLAHKRSSAAESSDGPPRSAVQRLVSDVKEEYKGQLKVVEASLHRQLEDLRQCVNREISSIKVNQRAVMSDVVEVVSGVDAGATTAAAAAVAQEAAEDAVAELTRRLLGEPNSKDPNASGMLGARLARCDAAAAACERCTRAIEERLRGFSEELRDQLVLEGGRLLGAVGASSSCPSQASGIPSGVEGSAAELLMFGAESQQTPLAFPAPAASHSPAARCCAAAAAQAASTTLGSPAGNTSGPLRVMGSSCSSMFPASATGGGPLPEPQAEPHALSFEASTPPPKLPGLPHAGGIGACLSDGGAVRAGFNLAGRQDFAGGQQSLLNELVQRVSHQEGALEDLKQQNAVLVSEVEEYRLEQKVSRSLAGLELRGRSAQLPVGTSATPLPIERLVGGLQRGSARTRKAVSLDSRLA